MRYGIVGGIGSGKSTVSEILKDLGCFVIDCDKVYKDISLTKEYIDLVDKAFPGSVVDGQIDRKILGEMVFNNKEKLSLLNSIAHPLVQKRIEEITKNVNSDIYIETQVINEELQKSFDKIILVTADMKIRIQRVIQRSGYSKDYVKKIIASQTPDSEYEKIADIIVINNKGKSELRQQLIKVLN